MKYLVAVSGGVDSVVLLDLLARQTEHELIVAHFDHGIRPDSVDDARFVEGLAGKYHLPFVTRREELGAKTGEETARARRYAFLRGEAQACGAVIVTAHHQDDLIETIAINFIRGTGWRGLDVLSAADVVRPLLTMTKADIKQYALEKRLEWVEDSTNASPTYLRNRIRRRLPRLGAKQREELVSLWRPQRELRREIETEAHRLVSKGNYERYLFIQNDEVVGIELLRAVFAKENIVSPTRLQLGRALLAIRVARGGVTFEVGNGVSLRFTTRAFIVMAP